MKVYQFDNTTQDEEFLKGRAVSGKVILRGGDDPIRKDDFLVVLLSTGKKFKGRIIDVRLFALDQYSIGEVEIIRT